MVFADVASGSADPVTAAAISCLVATALAVPAAFGLSGSSDSSSGGHSSGWPGVPAQRRGRSGTDVGSLEIHVR